MMLSDGPRWQVVEENLRQLCVFKLVTEKKQPWLWWQYAANYAEECTMANGKFGDAECVRDQLKGVSVDEDDVKTCMGALDADQDNELMEVRQPEGP
jgi:hypothetical protein